MLSLDDSLSWPDADGEPTSLDVISPDGGDADAADLRVDLARFLDNLPPALRRCLGWLVAGGAKAAMREGLHRSSFYEARRRLRARAAAYGLAEYL
jgi:hypothetical protein